MKNYYTILQLEPFATPEQIKKAYRFLATKYHPDKHDNDEFFKERFVEIQNAYNFLSKPEQKVQYDSELNDYLNPPKFKEPEVKSAEQIKYEQANQHIAWTKEWYESGNWQKALEEIDKAIKLTPNYAVLFHIRADICRSINIPLTALGLYKKAFKLGYTDSKSKIIELETAKDRDQSNYEKVLYKSFSIHITLIFVLAMRPKNIDFWLYSGICVFIAIAVWLAYLSINSKKLPAESKLMLNQSTSVMLYMAGGTFAFILMPFIIALIK